MIKRDQYAHKYIFSTPTFFHPLVAICEKCGHVAYSNHKEHQSSYGCRFSDTETTNPEPLPPDP